MPFSLQVPYSDMTPLQAAWGVRGVNFLLLLSEEWTYLK